jgi:alpha-beta hydrolase superfamily lysophospholipase
MATGGGNKGSRSDTWGRLPGIFAANGLSSLLFDFAGQGRSGGDRKVLTLAKGVANLKDVLSVASQRYGIKPEDVALLGSSYGGNVVLEYLAGDRPWPVRGAAFKSPCIDLRESYEQELGREGMLAWEREGYSASAGLNWEVISTADTASLIDRLRRITVPILITHGTSDESVPISQSRLVRDKAQGVVDLFEMKGTNHHYNERDDWQRMAAIHTAWLRQLFRHERAT